MENNNNKVKLECIDCQYNCNNTIIWAGYGMSNHEAWCEHQGGIMGWKNKKDININKPYVTITCDV